MKFISIEQCDTCSGGGSTAISNPNGPNVVDSNTSNLDKKKIDKTDATYDDGDGIKDTIMIDGPLSFAFTNALNQVFKKKPLSDIDETTTGEQAQAEDTAKEALDEKAENKNAEILKQNSPEQIGLATEDFEQLDESNATLLIKELSKNVSDMSFFANKFDFISSSELPVNVVNRTSVINFTDFVKPSEFCKFLESQPNSTIDHVVLVLGSPGALGRVEENTSKKVIQPFVSRQDIEAGPTIEEVRKVADNYIENCQVCFGFEEYVTYLKYLKRQLHV